MKGLKMLKAATIAALLLLPGCVTSQVVNCANAATAKAAAQSVIDAVDYACPVPQPSD